MITPCAAVHAVVGYKPWVKSMGMAILDPPQLPQPPQPIFMKREYILPLG